MYQFEVRFNNPEDCTDFAYSVHGKFVDGVAKISTVPFEETKAITSNIFQKARQLMDELNQELEVENDNDDDDDGQSSSKTNLD